MIFASCFEEHRAIYRNVFPKSRFIGRHIVVGKISWIIFKRMLAGLMHMSVAQGKGRLQGGCQRVAHAAQQSRVQQPIFCARIMPGGRASKRKRLYIWKPATAAATPPTLSLSLLLLWERGVHLCVTGNQPPLLLFCESFTSARTHTLTG